ncbi:MAG: tRNA (adenosine(37)-N6)-threonylcarbamoyltransferase complex ATPase subunit type 1 TsaE [Scytolyngbya sp. HA4215-MV1]|jgi:tRNA threonylcarbamoyladenosine biosynthesis protein TsaE|nr:tRNA (adenosine(37)-N6)-threonylcarbamoyltransferase complex ATPase subunit type 1 TsaE [Scytolyngbya sp. HA4215-MV1]
MSSQTIALQNAQATQALGIALGQTLTAGTVLLLTGDLGTGKTTLVQGLGRGLGIEATIDSPTFTLVNEYLQGRLPLYHLDLYRLEPAEVPTLQPELYWEGDEVEAGIVAIEWSERLLYRPPDYLQIDLTHQPDHTHQAILTAIGQCQLPSVPLPLSMIPYS